VSSYLLDTNVVSELRKHKPNSAATARLHQLTVVTRNVADFKALGVKTLDPFKSAGAKGA
jgi:predicted nucleic acid-binding protein